MRKPVLSLVILLGVVLSLSPGCASTGSTGQSEMFGQDFDIVFNAAVEAAREIGATIGARNLDAGVIAGRIPVETFGVAIDLDIRVDATLMWGAEVTVFAAERESPSDPGDAASLEDLTHIENLYLEILRKLIGQPIRGRTGTHRPR
jgi:hypothetical protein